jgi:hypothetical protein
MAQCNGQFDPYFFKSGYILLVWDNFMRLFGDSFLHLWERDKGTTFWAMSVVPFRFIPMRQFKAIAHVKSTDFVAQITLPRQLDVAIECDFLLHQEQR